MSAQRVINALNRKYGGDLALERLRATSRLVPGSGRTDRPAAVFIGEAPGAAEEREGIPFIGASGRLLDSMLEEIGLCREEVYVTNVVKYRPPNNRDPEPEEVAASMPYLRREIAAVRPRVIAPMGRFATAAVLPGAGPISSIHGLPRVKNGIPVMPLYHPAVALYNSSMRPTLIEDFLRLGGLLG